MEFGRHIAKGVWAFAGKALPALYGVGFVFLVARVLPKEEYGGYVIVQTMFNIISAVSYAFALQPLTKFAAETDQPAPLITASLYLQLFLTVTVSLVILAFKHPLATLLDPHQETGLTSLLYYVPLMLLASLYRNFAVSFLQSRYEVRRIFWIDAVYFLGVLAAIFVAHRFGFFHRAGDILSIAVIMFVCSSLLAIGLTRRMVSFTLLLQQEAISKMWSFGKFMFAGGVSYTLFAQMDLFFVTSYLGPVAAATYYNAKIFTRMFDLLAAVLQMFLVPFSSKAFARRDVAQLTAVAEKSICFSTIVLVPVFLIMVMFAEPVLHLLYNGRYDDAAPAVRIFSMLAFVVPWNAAAVGCLTGMGNLKRGFYASVGLVIIAPPMYALLTRFLGMIGASIGLVLAFTLVTAWIVRQLQQSIPLKFVNVLNRVKDVKDFLRRKSVSE